MPESIMMAVVAEIPYVTGKRIDIVATGPSPGRTPIRVPMKTPMKQKKRLLGSQATLKPVMRLPIKSITEYLLEPKNPGRQSGF
jgi:hypothetical protein